MEEFRKIRKQQQFPQQIKLRRKIFHNCRFHTLPNEERNSQPFQHSLKIYNNSTNRQSSVQRINIKNIDFEDAMRSNNKRIKFNNLMAKTKRHNAEVKQFIPLIIRKKNSRQQKSTKYRRLNMNSMRTCRNICTGYAKRTERTKQNHQIISQLFKDSTRIDTNKQKLFRNVKIMSKALRDSFPKNFLIYEQNDLYLRLKNQQFSNIFNGKMISIDSVR